MLRNEIILCKLLGKLKWYTLQLCDLSWVWLSFLPVVPLICQDWDFYIKVFHVPDPALEQDFSTLVPLTFWTRWFSVVRGCGRHCRTLRCVKAWFQKHTINKTPGQIEAKDKGFISGQGWGSRKTGSSATMTQSILGQLLKSQKDSKGEKGRGKPIHLQNTIHKVENN